jgi:pyochelin biosynthetic protein PchC
VETYTCPPDAVLSSPVTALVGDADPEASIDDVLAWREHTTGRFDLRVFPGGHFYLDALSEEVADTIRRTLGAGSYVSSSDGM